ncbi:MAG: cell division ATP-binding protein FtsE [Pseudomonadota bacterium]
MRPAGPVADIAMDYAVRLDNVTLDYGNADPVLDGLSLALTPGSFTFLTGPSGAGKTSLLKLMYLALQPTVGDMALFGRNTARMSRDQLSAFRRRIGVVFQEFRLLDHLTVYENAALPLRVAGRKEDDYRDDVEDLLKWVGLGPRMSAYPPTLSGGEQQRTAIARALVNKPDLLLADEPTGNVDPEMGARLLRLFVELNRRLGTTVLIATHDLDLIKQIDAPVLRLEHGFVVRDDDLGADQ